MALKSFMQKLVVKKLGMNQAPELLEVFWMSLAKFLGPVWGNAHQQAAGLQPSPLPVQRRFELIHMLKNMGGKNHIEWTLDGLGVIYGRYSELFAGILATGFGNLESNHLVAGIQQLPGAVSPRTPILKECIPFFDTQLCQKLEVRLIVTRPAAKFVCEQSWQGFIAWQFRGESLPVGKLVKGRPLTTWIPRNSVEELAGWTTPQGGEEIFSVDHFI